MRLVLRAERDRALDVRGDARAVAQEEEQQVEHHAAADDQLEGVLADAHGLGRDEAAGLRSAGRELLLHRSQVAEAEAIEQPGQPRRQGADELLHHGRDIDLLRLQVVVEQRHLLHQRGDQQPDRQDHDEQAQQHHAGGREIRPAAHQPQQAAMGRHEQQRQRRRPEDGTEEWPQDPGERDRYREEQQLQGPLLGRGGIHRSLRA